MFRHFSILRDRSASNSLVNPRHFGMFPVLLLDRNSRRVVPERVAEAYVLSLGGGDATRQPLPIALLAALGA